MNGIRSAGWLVASSLVLACAPAPPAVESPPPPAKDDLAAGEHVWTTADGTTMPYVVTGEGDVTVLLVHCWMGDHTFWSAQVPELARHHRTIAIDLPGHGQAGTGRASWSVAGYGEDVARMIEGLGLSDVVLVGHSMGGPVSLKAAALAAGRVRGIVAVDTLHDAEFDFTGERVEGFIRAFESDFAATCQGFVDQMFPEEGADELRARVKAASCGAERGAIGVALLRSFADIDMERWFSEARVPIRAVNAAEPTPTQVERNRKYADFDAVTLDEVGHYLHMTRPEAFNPLLLEAIDGILDGSGGARE